MLLAFTSDLHTDAHASNRQVWQEMVAILRDMQPDVFVCCGDIAADAQQFGVTVFALEHLPCKVARARQSRCLDSEPGLGSARYHQSSEVLPALTSPLSRRWRASLWLEPYVHGDIAFCGTMGWYDYSLRNPAFDGEISTQDYRRKHFQDRLWNDRRFVV